MNILSLFAFLCCMVSLALGAYTYRMDSMSRLNRLFILISLNFALWSFSYTFFYSAPDRQTAWFWYKVSTLGWAFAPAIALHYFLVLTGNDSWLKSRLHAACLYVPGLFFLVKQLTGTLLVSDFVWSEFGWCEVATSDTVLFWLYQLYFASTVFAWIVMTYRWSVRSDRMHVRKQGLAIVLTAVISMLVIGTFDTILPAMGVYVMPSIAPIVIMLWLLGIWYAMVRYRLMVLTPSIAVDDIVATMSDLLILGNHDGKIIKMNNRALGLLACEEKDVVGRPVASIFRESDQVLSLCNEVMQGTSTMRKAEMSLAAANGEMLPFYVSFSSIWGKNNELSGVMLVGQDLRHVKKLVESERKYRSLVDNAPVGVYRTDLRGKIQYVNAVVANIYDYANPDELLAVNTVKSYIGRKELLSIMALLKKSGRVVNFETEIATRTGAVKQVLVSAVVEGSHLSGMLMDISYRKKMESYVMRSRNLESLGVLAGGIAHDFNNLLTAIVGNISLAKYSLEPGVKIFERLEIAEKACDRAKLLSNQLRTFSKGGQPVKSRMSVESVVRDASAIALSGSALNCVFRTSEGVWDIEADEGQISQVFHNLLINARDAMPETGMIIVTVQNIEHPGAEWLPLKEGRYVKVSVQDQGTGIAQEHLQSIFDPYFTTKTKGAMRGTGLGLSLSYSIVEKHEGLISVDSKVGQGTIFHVYLAAAAPSDFFSERFRSDGRVPEHPERGSGRILVMDDEEMVRAITADMLRMKGYEVVTAADGLEAVQCYRAAMNAGTPFDLVLMDLIVPAGMGGREAVGVLLEVDPQVKAVVWSGYADDPVMADHRRFGFAAAVHKPCPVEKLHGIIHGILTQRAGAWYDRAG